MRLQRSNPEGWTDLRRESGADKESEKRIASYSPFGLALLPALSCYTGTLGLMWWLGHDLMKAGGYHIENNEACVTFAPKTNGTPPTYGKLRWMLSEKYPIAVLKNTGLVKMLL